MKALLIGSVLVKELEKNLEFFEEKFLLVNESPLADNFIEKIESLLKRNEQFDCVLIDLMICGAWLFKEKGCFKTLHNELNAKEVFNPTNFRCSAFEKNYNEFIKLLSDYYEEKQIFIISASLPPYFITQNQLRNINKTCDILEWKQTIRFIKNKEIEFTNILKKVNIINLSDFYFIKKQNGFDVSYLRFENELYKDINQWFYDYSKNIYRQSPDFRISLDRYIKYQYKTIHYKAFNRFLDEKDIVHKLILSSPRQFVIQNYDNFIFLKNFFERLTIDQYCEELLFSEKNMSEEFKIIVRGFFSLETRGCWEINYDIAKEMFIQGIISKEVKKEIRDYWGEHGINVNIINNSNSGYYFAKMRGVSNEKAIEFVSENVVVNPPLVDVYGSCISYQTINEHISGINNIAHNNYYMHVPVFESSDDRIIHTEVVWEGETVDEFEKNVRIQFEHEIEEDINKSEANWCLVDLFSMVAPRTFLYKDFIFTDYGNKTWVKFDAKNIHPWNGYYQKLLQDPNFLKKIQEWTRWLKNKYGENIILVDFKVSKYKIGDDDSIYYAYKNADRKNEIIDRVYELVKKWLNCYCIEIGREFLADDVGYSSSGSVHYELEFYEIEGEIVQDIICNKPCKKIYDFYSNEVRVDRIIRLKKNNEINVLRQIFTKELDKYIISLSYNVLVKFREEIIQFYNLNIVDTIQLLREISKLEVEKPLYYYELKKEVMDNIGEEKDWNDDFEIDNLKTKYEKLEEVRVYNNYRLKLMKNTTYTIEFYDKNEFLFKQKVIYGVKATLKKIQSNNENFLGWKAYRMSDGKVCCLQKNLKRSFIYEEDLDENNTLYLFPDGANVAKNSKIDGDIIRMYAQWKEI